MLQAKQVEREKYDNVVSEIKEAIEFITDAQSANDFIDRIDEFEHVGSSKSMAAQLLSSKANMVGLVLDKSTKRYIDKVAQPSLL